MPQRGALILAGILLASASLAAQRASDLDNWSSIERSLIDSLLIDNLGPPPPDPSNRFADNPVAAKLGKQIFNDPRFSANGAVSCSTCHRAEYQFTDSLPLAQGIGTTTRRSMPLAGVAYQNWFFWDGRSDSLWAQALDPLENPLEHGISRASVSKLIQEHYRENYAELFGPIPKSDEYNPLDDDQVTRIFVNVGKAVAAFVRQINPGESAFDRYARALAGGDTARLTNLTPRQTRGLRLFISRAKCINCHNGPLLTNGEFHHAGVSDEGEPDRGRAAVMNDIRVNEFGYFSQWSDADPATDGDHIRYLDTTLSRYERSFKTPSLRGVAQRPPYMHAGQFATLSEVLSNYRDTPREGLADELSHGDLNDEDLRELEAFLISLSSPAQPR